MRSCTTAAASWASLASWAACLLINLFAVQAHAERTEQCVDERDPVTVSGEIHRQRRASASSDGWSAPRGKKETAVLLKLRKPLCVMLPDDVNMAPRPRRIHEVQLLSDDKLPRSSDKLHHVEGTVVFANSTDHHQPVLLEVKQIDEGSKRATRHR
jgi:hypothetical protein